MGLGGMMMAENAFIKLVPSSAQQTITVEEVKELLSYYKNITSKTGNQVDWEYGDSAFPYEVKEKVKAKENGFIYNRRMNGIMQFYLVLTKKWFVMKTVRKEFKHTYKSLFRNSQHLVIKAKQMNFANS